MDLPFNLPTKIFFKCAMSLMMGGITGAAASAAGLVGQTKSGRAENHAAGVKAAQRAIDKALAPKKTRLIPPK